MVRRYRSGIALSQEGFGSDSNQSGGWISEYSRSLSLSASLYGSGYVKHYTETSFGWIPRPDGKFTPSQDFFHANRPDGRSIYWKRDGGRFTNEGEPDEWAQKIAPPSGPEYWIYYSASTSEVEQYSADGRRLISLQTHDGSRRVMNYSDGGNAFLALDDSGNATSTPIPGGKLVEVADQFGRNLRFFYDLKGRIAKVSAPDSQFVRYSYSQAGDLVRVSYPDGSSKNYLYNETGLVVYPRSPGLLTGTVDEAGGRFSTFQYDIRDRIVQSSHTGGVDQHGFAYFSTNSFISNQVRVTDPIGTSRDYYATVINGVAKSTGVSQPGGSGCGASSSAISYDANGNIASQTDFAGLKTCHANDLNRNLETARLEGLAASSSCPSDVAAAVPGAGQRKFSTQWHPFWRLEARRAEPKRITTRVYNGQPDPTNGNAIVSCAPLEAKLPDGQPIAVLCKQLEQPTTDSTGAAAFAAAADGPARTWSYTYNQYGQVLTADGPRTDVADITTYTYYPDSTANWTLGDLKSVTNALGHVWNYTQYDKAGRLLAASDPNGSAYTFTYTPRGWLKTRSVAGQTTTFDYTPWGGVARVTLPDGTFTAYTWDAAHRLTDISDSLGNATHLTLDNAGNITESSTTDPQGRVARRTRTDFDALGRPWKHYDAAGNVTETRHDAEDRLNALVDAKSRTTTYTRDSLGRVQGITNPLPSPGYSGFNYDALDQLTRFVAPNGATTTLTVDGMGNIKQELSADRGTVTATFDAAGNLLTRIDARGASTAHTYDALDRRTQTQFKNSAGTVTQTLAYTWDSAAGCANGKGRLCKLVDGAGTTTFNYDSRGNRISETRLDGGSTYTTQYTFNAADRLIAVITPTGTLLDQALDGAGRVQSQTTTQGGTTAVVASAITYDGAGAPTSLMHAGGLPQVLQRNTDGKLEASSLGNASVLMGILFGQRFIPNGGSTNFLVAMTPPQVGGTIRLCRLDCLGPNLLAEGSPVDGVRITGSIQGLPVGVHHLYAVFSPNPPFIATTSQTRRLFVGIPPNRFFEDLLP